MYNLFDLARALPLSLTHTHIHEHTHSKRQRTTTTAIRIVSFAYQSQIENRTRNKIVLISDYPRRVLFTLMYFPSILCVVEFTRTTWINFFFCVSLIRSCGNWRSFRFAATNWITCVTSFQTNSFLFECILAKLPLDKSISELKCERKEEDVERQMNRFVCSEWSSFVVLSELTKRNLFD